MAVAPLYWAAADVLALASSLGTAADLPPADVMRRRVVGLLDQMDAKGAQAGVPRADLLEARYAIVAFLDEQVSRSPWHGKHQWLAEPLQLVLFNENTAGEGFFQHLGALERDGSRLAALEIYYLCLALGFQGQFAIRGGQGLAAQAGALGARLAAAVYPGEALSPHGLPRDGVRFGVAKPPPLVALGAGLFAAAVVLYVVLRVVLSFQVSSVTASLDRVAA
ncbi:MAG TPA: type IVB secretion system protein IcmH/DotU, partial [Polyangiaceae bacterium]|nr:type IVB secretion system protein IcmH/DotU [Polyangiaceae bacterium]